MRLPVNWRSAVAVIEAAHAAGLPVSGHIAYPLPLIAAGIDGKEHMGQAGDRSDDTIYDDILQLSSRANLWVVPTIIGFSATVRVMDEPGLLDRPDTAPFLTPFLRWWAQRLPASSRTPYARFAATARESARKLIAAGIVVGAGADTPYLPWALHAELEELVKAGMSPSQAIAAATSVAARIIGAEQEIGTIEPGKLADLIVLNADPLENIGNTRSIWRVIKGGEIYDPEVVRDAAKQIVTQAPSTP